MVENDGSGMANHYDDDDDRTKKADARFYAWSTAEWVGMPEYVQEELRPRYQVRVNFSGHEDLATFAELVGTDITTKTKTIWFPPVEEMQVIGRIRYINEDNLEQEEAS